MINLSVRGYELTIGGLNCTDAMLSITGGDNKITANSGIVSAQYEIVLGRPIGFESLDDRINNRWARGAEIVFRLQNSSLALLRPSRFGSLNIQDAVFDQSAGPGGQLKIQAVDLLTLLAGREQEENATEICIGTGATVQATVNQLLTSAGVPPEKLVIEEIPGTIGAPINPSGGYIAQAGELAAGVGWYLFVDGTTGRIAAAPIDVDQAIPLTVIDVTRQAREFDRLIDSPPAQKIKVTTRGQITRSIQRNGDIEVSEEYGPASLAGIEGSDATIIIERVTKRDTLSGANRTVYTVTERPQGALFPGDPDLAGTNLMIADETTERWFFEAANPVTGGADACSQGNTGRLLRKTTFTLQPQGVAVASAIAVMKPKISKTQQIVAVDEWITYEYLPPFQTGPGTTKPLGRGPRIRRSKRQPLGAVIPDFYAPDAFPKVTTPPSNLVFTEYEFQEWWQPSQSEWTYKRRLSRAVGLSKPDLMARRSAYARENNISFNPIASFATPVPSESENDRSATQSQPPAPETLPASIETEPTESSETVDFPVNGAWPYREAKTTLTFNNVPDGVIDVAKKQAQRWGKIGWGRYKGSKATCALLDYFFTCKPLDRVDLVEPASISANLCDGFAFSMVAGTEARAQVGFEAIFLGRQITPSIPPALNTIADIRTIPANARYDGMIAFAA